MTTMVTSYPMAECIGVAIGSNVIVYYDKDGDGRVDPTEFATMGPADQPFRFKDAIATWDGKGFVAPCSTGGSSGYTQADIDRAVNAALDKVDAAVKGARR